MNKEHTYWEPYDLVLDWVEARSDPLSQEQEQILHECGAQIEAYTGRAYADIRIDIARTAISKLTEVDLAGQPIVSPMPLKTIYVVKQEPIASAVL